MVEHNGLRLLFNVRVLDFKSRINRSANVFEGAGAEEILSTPPLLLGRRGTEPFESERELSAFESLPDASPTPRRVSARANVLEA